MVLRNDHPDDRDPATPHRIDILRHLKDLDFGLASVDSAGIIRYANPWLLSKQGLPASEALGTALEQPLTGLPTGLLIDTIARALRTGLSVPIMPGAGPDGDGQAAALLTVRPLGAACGDECLVEFFDADLLSPPVAATSRTRRTARYHAVLETSTESFLTLDDRGRIIWINPAAESRFGRSLTQTLGQPLHLLFPDVKDYAWPAGGLIRTVALSANGRRSPVEIAIGSWSGEGGSYRTLFVRLLDASAADIADSALVPAPPAAPVSQIVHEFNNLIMVIQVNAGLISATSAPDDLVEAAQEIGQAADRAATLTGRLAAIAGDEDALPPLAAPSSPTPPPHARRPAPAPTTPRRWSRLRILRVSPDPQAGDQVRQALGDGALEVTQVSDGVQALDCLETLSFDLLFSDIRLPDCVPGPLLVREVAGLFPGLGLLLTDKDAVLGRQVTAGLPPQAQLLPQPFTPAELAQAVSVALAAAGGA